VDDGNGDGYGFIQSKSGLVLDIQGASTAAYTSVVAFGQNHPATDNQLWKFDEDGSNKGYSYIQSKSGLVLDVNPAPVLISVLILHTKKPSLATLMASSKVQPLSPPPNLVPSTPALGLGLGLAFAYA
jgi:hypothetical protein